MKYLIALVFALTVVVYGHEGEHHKESAPDPVKQVLPTLPVTVAEGLEQDLGKIYMNETRFFQFTVRNTSDKPLKYNRVTVNCSCSRLSIPIPGVIEPGKELPVKVELDARKIKQMGPYKKSIRMDFLDYEPLVMDFVGDFVKDVQILMFVDGQELPFAQVPVTYIETAMQNWERSMILRGTFEDGRKLEFGEPYMTDPQSHRCELVKLGENLWNLKIRPSLPQKMGMIKNEAVLPMVAPREGSLVKLELNGMVCSMLEATVDELYWDPEKDPEELKQTFALSRLPFNHRIMRVALFFGRQNPYFEAVKILKVEEVQLPEVPGVRFELTQGRGGVFVHCYFQGSKMSPKGVEGEFKVLNSQSCKVLFAVMNDEIRKELAELAQTEKEVEEAKNRATSDESNQQVLPVKIPQ